MTVIASQCTEYSASNTSFIKHITSTCSLQRAVCSMDRRSTSTRYSTTRARRSVNTDDCTYLSARGRGWPGRAARQHAPACMVQTSRYLGLYPCISARRTRPEKSCTCTYISEIFIAFLDVSRGPCDRKSGMALAVAVVAAATALAVIICHAYTRFKVH